MIIGNSLPLWVPGEKSDPFGNFYPGIPKVADRLKAICQLPRDVCGWTSFHTLHEVRTKIKAYRDLNSPNAIDLSEVKHQLKDAGKKVLAVTVPAFGLKDFWRGGAILSNDPAVRLRTRDLICEGAETCLGLQEDGIGEGVFIWWPATDSLRYPFSDSDLVNGRNRLIDFWAEILTKYPKLRIWLEWKPADPGDRDYFADYGEAIVFAWSVNLRIGRIGVLLNFEFAHASICGDDVDEVTETILDPASVIDLLDIDKIMAAQRCSSEFVEKVTAAPLVDLIVHVNSSVKKGPDQDKRVGAVNNEETTTAVKMLDKCPQKVVAEHDIKCLDGDPIGYYRQSVEALQEMQRASD